MFCLCFLPCASKHATRITRIGRIFTDTFNPCASVKSVFHRFIVIYEPQFTFDSVALETKIFAPFAFFAVGFYVTPTSQSTLSNLAKIT